MRLMGLAILQCTEERRSEPDCFSTSSFASQEFYGCIMVSGKRLCGAKEGHNGNWWLADILTIGGCIMHDDVDRYALED